MEVTAGKKSDWDAHIRSADQAQREGKYEYAEATWMLALEEAENFGEGDRRLAYTLEKLSECLWFQNRLDESSYYGRRALTVYEACLGVNHADVGAIVGNLAMIHHLQGKHDDAEGFYKRAIAIKTSALGQKHPEVQKLLSSFADLLQSVGRNEEAAQLRTSATVVTKKAWNKTGSHKQFGTVSREDFGQSSIPVPPSALDSDQTLSWEQYKSEAEAALARGDLLEAQRAWISSLPVARGADENNPNYCYAMDSLGELSIRMEKFKDAERCFQKSYDIKLKVLGKEHGAVATSASALAKLYYMMCDYLKAETFAKQAVDIHDKTSGGADSKDLACALHNLATLYHVQKKFENAESNYERAMKMKQKLFGPDHPETLSLLKSYANLLKSTHREEQAKHLDACADGMITGTWKQVKESPKAQTGSWRQVLLGDA